ncbi:MAG: prolipoprotein diacylglyceryl transferase [Niabella sp.]
MYPNFYYLFEDWFGVQWGFLRFVNSFGFFVAISFLLAAYLLTHELKRKEREGLLKPEEEEIEVGRPAGMGELITNFILGFILGYKLLGLFFAGNLSTINPQEYIFSSQGSWLAGIAAGLLLAFLKWQEKNKHKLEKPEKRKIRVWPHDRVGEMTTIAVVFGILGAKLFDTFENWDSFVKDPSSIFSMSGLTFYGGLICAGIALWWYTKKHQINFWHFTDIMGPVMMMAYGVGRIGCQVSGDGDWGIYNAAYKTSSAGGIFPAAAGEFEQAVSQHAPFFANHGSTHAFFSKPGFLNFLPDWFFAYDFPHNVNEFGTPLDGCAGAYCAHLPIPVFPTSLYEIIVCLILFTILWLMRKKIRIPGLLFGIYLIFNGLERFFIEKIRVNVKMDFLGMQITQAELISFGLIIFGIIVAAYCVKKHKPALPVINS